MPRENRERKRLSRGERHTQIEHIVATRLSVSGRGMSMSQIARSLRITPSPYVQGLLDDMVLDDRLDFVELDYRGGVVPKTRMYLVPYDRLDGILDQVYGRSTSTKKVKRNEVRQ